MQGGDGFHERQHETQVRKLLLNIFERQTEKKSLIITQHMMLNKEHYFMD